MFLRNRISLEQRERIVRAFEDVHEDYLAIAETIGVNGRSTARGIVSRYVREGRIAERPRGGANRVRVDDAMRDCLDDIINENCLLTIAEMNRELRLRLPHKPVIHDRTVARAIPGPNSILRKLPPYSPFLNIVEQAVSALKAAIKADISRPEIQVQMNDCAEARRQGLALGNYRTQLLLQALQRNIGTITVAKCGQWFRFMQTYLPRCINNEAIEG